MQQLAIVLFMPCEALMIGSLHLDDELHDDNYFCCSFFFIVPLMTSVSKGMMHGDAFLCMCVSACYMCVFQLCSTLFLWASELSPFSP